MKPQSRTSEPTTSVAIETSPDLPAAFCWTKMGTEAGQPLSVILARKEAERQLGDGIFFWGIGNALGQKIWELADSFPQPLVVFTGMKSQAKAVDINPARVVVWTAYYDRYGFKHLIPPFAFVTSRADTRTRINQTRYALVCRSPKPLCASHGKGPIHSRRLVNYRSQTNVAPSQVTAVVQISSARSDSGRKYDIAFTADLVAPYYVKLADPVDISSAVLAEINRIPLASDFSADKWREYLDERFKNGQSYPVQMGLLTAYPGTIARRLDARGFCGQACAD